MVMPGQKPVRDNKNNMFSLSPEHNAKPLHHIRSITGVLCDRYLPGVHQTIQPRSRPKL